MTGKEIRHFNVWSLPTDLTLVAHWYNNVQLLAEESRLGIPVTIASDPRHHFSNNIFSMAATNFSQFCEMPGFAAIGDENLVREFAEVVRMSSRLIGFKVP